MADYCESRVNVAYYEVLLLWYLLCVAHCDPHNPSLPVDNGSSTCTCMYCTGSLKLYRKNQCICANQECDQK